MVSVTKSIKEVSRLAKIALRLSCAAIAVSIGLFIASMPAVAGPLLVFTFALAAYGVRSSERLRGISFSLLILAAVVFALCFPEPLVSWGEFRLSTLITPLLQLIMFGMGVSMSLRDFGGVAKMPKLVFIGTALQYTIMPFMGFALTLVFPLEPEVAAGVILIGAAPSGLASNVMTYISKGNLALSVTVTTLATLLAPLFTPFYMQWLGGQFIEVDPWDMMVNILRITVVPIVAGLVFNRFLHGRTAWLDRLMPALSMAGIVLILMIMTASGRDNLLEIGLLLIVISLIHNVTGYTLGYWSARLLGADERSCRTIAFEVGQQNAGLATGLAQEMGKIATVGLVPTVFGSLMNITGATLATWWRDKPPRDGVALAIEGQPQSVTNLSTTSIQTGVPRCMTNRHNTLHDMKATRRAVLATLAGAAVLPLVPRALLAQPPAAPAGPISSQATVRDWSGATPVRYPDPDIVTLDPSFRRCVQFNSPILRLHTGTLWAEGPAWNGVGRYMVWSDIPNDVQMRWIEDDARVTQFRSPSNNSNGNTFDYQGRQLSAEHGARRVVRYEPDGKVTVIADRYNGKRLNSPNDLVVHPDGSIWFTDPSFGIRAIYEGSIAESETKEAVYRVDAESGEIALVTDEVGQPNGLCFSPDYSKLYVADSGQTKVWDVDGTRLRNARTFAMLTQPDGSPSSADGIRCDQFGNVWAGARPGVLVANPEGQTIGAIRLPEVCANVCFGGPKRNRLFMTASQSLYAVYIAATGAHIC